MEAATKDSNVPHSAESQQAESMQSPSKGGGTAGTVVPAPSGLSGSQGGAGSKIFQKAGTSATINAKM